MLVLLLLAALAARWTGIGFLAPEGVEPDGIVLLEQVEIVRGSERGGHEDPNWSFYPHLLARAVALLPEASGPLPADAGLEQHLARAAAPLVRARRVMALLSLLAIPGTYWLARRFLPRAASLLAAALAAASLLSTWFAQQARPHAPAAAFALLAVVAALRLRARPTRGAYVLAGGAAGLAVSALQSGVFVIPALLVAHLARERTGGARDAGGPARLGLALLLAAAVAVPFHPFLVGLRPEGAPPALESREGVLELLGHSLPLAEFDGSGFRVVAWTLLAFETGAVVLALVALLSGAARGARVAGGLAVVLAYVVPYALVLGLYGRTQERFALQLVPYLCVLAACAPARLRTGGRVRAALGGSLATLALALSVASSASLVRLRAVPDPTSRVAEWIETHLDPATARIAVVPFLGLPLVQTEEALEADRDLGWALPWREHELQAELAAFPGKRWNWRFHPLARPADFDAAAADPVAYFNAAGATHVVLPAPFTRGTNPHHRAIREALRARGGLLFRAPPDASGEDGETVVTFQDVPAPGRVWWSLHLLAPLSCAGWVMEVHRVGDALPAPGGR